MKPPLYGLSTELYAKRGKIILNVLHRSQKQSTPGVQELIFQKFEKPPQNYRYPKGDMKVPY